MSLRPKRCVSRPNYTTLVDVKIPKRTRMNYVHREREVGHDLGHDRLYRLEIVEEDVDDPSRVKVLPIVESLNNKLM